MRRQSSLIAVDAPSRVAIGENPASARQFERLLHVAGLFLFGVFVCLTLWTASCASMGYDDAYNASIAKNVALGMGYGSTYGGFHPFNPEVTTGPTLILPVALGISLFGPQIWAPQVFTALAALSMLGAILLSSARVLRLPLGLVCLTCIPALLLLTQLNDGWSRMRGDIVACEFIVLAVLWAPSERTGGSELTPTDLGRGFLAGVFLGAACLTKLRAAPAALALLGVAAVGFILSKTYRRRGGAALISAALGGFSLAPTLFELARLVAVGPENYWAAKAAELANIRTQDTDVLYHGLFHLDRLMGAADRIEALIGYVGLARHPWLGAAAAFVWLVFGVHALRCASPGVRWRLAALGFSALAMLCWWVGIASWSAFVPRTQIGNGLMALFAGLITAVGAQMYLQRRSRLGIGGAVAGGALLGLAFLAATWGWQFCAEVRARGAALDRDILSARAAVLNIQQAHPNAQFCAIGWTTPRSLEYVLPRSGNFDDCGVGLYRRIRNGRTARRPVYLVREPLHWGQYRNLNRPALARACDRQIVFLNGAFTISRCP